MSAFENIIQDFDTIRENGLTHRRPFLNLKNATGRYTRNLAHHSII
ncbi:MAG: hypothetical protein ABGW91_14690 [Christiangramia sp.]|uniref:Uncharacterized protein n=1 Tax=Christiangramia flava JLT2011 TaxID=1229726 RepID=A0A1L7I9R3_9FLAO|nr:hypothetical protein [Christiangramia flava]APU69954.1 hypothetical protein GRFL_3230 [Christiangramia flava JLT2011]OSS39439.1 hypothetical protein C723_1341 [Christiangramia flava JLT2011]